MWVMVLSISRTHKRQLLDWATEAGNHECCGLLLGTDGQVERVELAANVADEPTDSFEIDPAALIAAEKRARLGGLAVLGYFHSHPNGVASPSGRDAEMASADGRRWIIIADGRITAWRPINDGQSGRIVFGAEEFDEG